MNIKSEPAIIEIPVTFFDIIYLGGIPDSITLKAEDTLELLAETITVTILNPAETIYIERRNVLCVKVRKGVIKRLPATKPAISTGENNLLHRGQTHTPLRA